MASVPGWWTPLGGLSSGGGGKKGQFHIPSSFSENGSKQNGTSKRKQVKGKGGKREHAKRKTLFNGGSACNPRILWGRQKRKRYRKFDGEGKLYSVEKLRKG